MFAVPADIPWSSVVIVVPIGGGMICFLSQRLAKWLGVSTALLVAFSVTGLCWQVFTTGPARRAVGGWSAPLGIELYADGLTVLMLATTALVGVKNHYVVTV